MKFLVVLCLLAVAAADDDKLQDKKTQPADAIQNASSLIQPATSLLNSQVFPPTVSFPSVFATSDPNLQVSNLAYSGYNGNVSPIQSINPDFFAAAAPGVVNAAIPTFPVTRTVLPGTASVVNGIQSAFPVTGNVFPAVVPAAGAISNQFPVVGAGLLSAVNGMQAVATGVPGNAAANGVIQSVPAATYRFLSPEGYSGLPTQGLQAAQQVGLAAIPAFTGGILPSLANNVLQGQNIPAGLQQILSNPQQSAGIPNVAGLTTGNISGPLTNVFRQA